MNIATARLIVCMIAAPVRLHSPDDKAPCPLCATAAMVYKTLTDAAVIVRYNRCPACGLTFKAVAPPKLEMGPSKIPDSATVPPKSCKVKVGKKKRGR